MSADMALVQAKRGGWLVVASLMAIFFVFGVMRVLSSVRYGLGTMLVNTLIFAFINCPLMYWIGMGALRRARRLRDWDLESRPKDLFS